MQANAQVERRAYDPVAFHLTGKRPAGEPDAIEGLRPALLAQFRDLAQLRYDYPLVLVEGQADGAGMRSLSGLIDGMLQKIAPAGPDSEQLRKMVLQLEREIRVMLSEGADGSLSELWDVAAGRLAARTDASFGQSVRIARAALDADGPVVDCDAAIAGNFVSHVWANVQAGKARRFRAVATRLAVKLDDILRSEFLRSPAGRAVDSLKAGIGGAHQQLFDFAAMSRLLPQATQRDALPENRRRRIEWALWVLKRQRFFARAAGQDKPSDAGELYSFTFETCADALAAFGARLADMVDLVKALSIAELEVDGAYVDSKHDTFFDRFDANALSPQDMALFPDYLVILGVRPSAADNAGLLDALSSGIPLKVVVNVDDLTEEGPPGDGHFTFGLRSAQLASMATGIGEAFVLQSASSNLYQMRDRVLAGLAYQGPALFSIFTGVPGNEGVISRYLSAASAMQARAFPAFTYDPSAGHDLASRFSLENNPQPDVDWTVQSFEYADDDLQRVTERAAFTFVDFLSGDPRYARHFARVTRKQWNDRMMPVVAWMSRPATGAVDAVPFVWAVDSNDLLVRVIADDKAIAATRRCLEIWHRLQEFGGVHNSHADRLLAREKAAWEEEHRHEKAAQPAAAPAPTAAAAPAPAVAPSAAAAPAAEAKEPERSPDEAYIETARCSSCNECIQLNDRMFAYNDNKQAYIANVDAGTYRQLVDAAESCQIGIIHPGKPRNKNEAGLDELMQRAAAFV